MKRFLTALSAILVLSACGNDMGRVEKFIREDPLRASSNMHRYEVLDSSVTRAPLGYKPFYISHIGRHGSRGTNEARSYHILDTLRLYDSLGLITPDAVKLADVIEGIRDCNVRVGYGILTDRGALEHREIARRMREHYPEVFSDPSRPEVCCYSTASLRVMESMDNFCASLLDGYPELSIGKHISKQDPRFSREVNHNSLTPKMKKYLDKATCTPFRDSILALYDWSRLVEKTFADGTVPECLKDKEGKFFYRIFKAGMAGQCYLTDTLGRVEDYFNSDELYTLWNYINTGHMMEWGWVEENRGYKAYGVINVLEAIIEDAEAAVAGGDTCATLRFTHDSIVLPLTALMGLDWNDWHGSYRQISKHSCMAHTMHMGGNVQLVFFRNARGKVLVKIMLNEEETFIPALKPDRKGVFYEWDRLRDYFTETMETLENNINA